MSRVIPLPVKVFTRDEPVTKVHMANAFWNGKQFIPRAIVQTRGIIGLNAPKYLIREGLARIVTAQDVDMLELTPSGQRWLTEGLAKHLKRHPEQAADLSHKPPHTAVKRATTAAPAPAGTMAARRPRIGLQAHYKRPR